MYVRTAREIGQSRTPRLHQPLKDVYLLTKALDSTVLAPCAWLQLSSLKTVALAT